MVNADPESVEKGLAQLVLTLIELLRQLMERQALRRMDQGSLDDEQVERLGLTFMRLAERMDELKAEFELSDEDLNLDLGPISGSFLSGRRSSRSALVGISEVETTKGKSTWHHSKK